MSHFASESLKGTRHKMRAVAASCLMALAFAPFAARAADDKAAMTFAEFRSQLTSQQTPPPAGKSSEKKAEPPPAPDFRVGERAFFRLLAAQGRVAAERQSVDRLAGWLKSAEVRVQAQSAPETDVALLRLTQGRAAARLARFEAERLRATRDVNLALKRPASSPFTAMQSIAATSGKQAAPMATGPKAPDIDPDPASRRAQYETVLLPAGNELLNKTYQSYLFGGKTLTELLWQEQAVFATDIEYHNLLVEMERQSSAAGARESKR